MINHEGYAFGSGSTHQCGSGIAEETRLNGARGSCASQAICGFPNASISISSTSARGETGVGDPGAQGGFYRQASGGSGPSSEAIGPSDRRNPKRHGRTGSGGLSQTKRTWLKEGAAAQSRGSIIKPLRTARDAESKDNGYGRAIAVADFLLFEQESRISSLRPSIDGTRGVSVVRVAEAQPDTALASSEPDAGTPAPARCITADGGDKR